MDDTKKLMHAREATLFDIVKGFVERSAKDDDLSPLVAYAEAVVAEIESRDPMPAGWNRPAPATRSGLVATLRDALAHVQDGDSWEGTISWSMPTDEPELEGSEFGLIARYRIGNLQGQGGVRVYQP